MRIATALLCALVVTLTGCAASFDRHTEKLEKVTSDEYVRFDEDVEYVEQRGAFGGVAWREGLAKGIYRLEARNEKGSFYRGPGACVRQYVQNTAMGPFEGGIWVPRDRINDRPMIYYYFNYNAGTAGAAGGALLIGILEAGKGSLSFMPTSKPGTFLDKVQVTNLPLEPQALR
ncbi:hypothetical protein ACQ859_25790 [Roseateles chitinivorans]|uniref:hypothetical protein n=1 Tax=Roseateles chitinivorans TaxID=2917965 RepID=UPI003D66CBA2